MKRKILSLFLCSVMLMGSVCGCESKTDEQSSSSKVVHVDGTFDIEEVRKNINIKGYEFIVPQKLSELDNGLTYEFVDEEFGDGFYEVEISDKSAKQFKTRNYHKRNWRNYYGKIKEN